MARTRPRGAARGCLLALALALVLAAEPGSAHRQLSQAPQVLQPAAATPGAAAAAGAPASAVAESSATYPDDDGLPDGAPGPLFLDPEQAGKAGGSYRCSTPQLTAQQRLVLERRVRLGGLRSTPAATVYVVPTYWQVIGGAGNVYSVTDAQVVAQISRLNAAFAGSFSFALMAINRTADPAWSPMAPGSTAELRAKAAMRAGRMGTLNIWSVKTVGSTLGWALYPQARFTSRDGVVVAWNTLPGGNNTNYNQGCTAIHEVGHWLSLFHTFEGGCTAVNDQVDDTPAEALPGTGCQPTRDTCRSMPGLDPVRNYMDYSFDSCMTGFTPLQMKRMQAGWVAFRLGKR